MPPITRRVVLRGRQPPDRGGDRSTSVSACSAGKRIFTSFLATAGPPSGARRCRCFHASRQDVQRHFGWPGELERCADRTPAPIGTDGQVSQAIPDERHSPRNQYCLIRPSLCRRPTCSFRSKLSDRWLAVCRTGPWSLGGFTVGHGGFCRCGVAGMDPRQHCHAAKEFIPLRSNLCRSRLQRRIARSLLVLRAACVDLPGLGVCIRRVSKKRSAAHERASDAPHGGA